MKALTLAATAALLGAFAPSAIADGREPGSVLIFPVHKSGGNLAQFFTIVCVTNTNTLPAPPFTFGGGSTAVHYEYVNVVPGATWNYPAACTIFDRREFLTPADTFCVLTSCHNAFAPGGQSGYLVVSAENPSLAPGAQWSHNYLIGSELVMSTTGVTYQVNAFASSSPQADGTDLTAPNGQINFNGVLYELLPDVLMTDFVAATNSKLALLNLGGNHLSENAISFTVYNDNEFPLSAHIRFRCWFHEALTTVHPLFSDAFLSTTPNDPDELDIDCFAGNVTVETGWFEVDSDGVFNAGGALINPDGALLGSITSAPNAVQGGHLLWERGAQPGAFRIP